MRYSTLMSQKEERKGEKMFEIDFKSRKTVSEQILENMKELILSGVLEKEEKLPSVREMAKILTVNPNTVQKAYRTLERQGYIYTSRGRGTFVSDAEKFSPDKKDLNEARHLLEDAVNAYYLMGIDRKTVRETVEEIMDKRREWL